MNYETNFPRDASPADLELGGGVDDGEARDRRKRLLIIGAVLVALAIAAFAFWKYRQSEAAAATEAATSAAGRQAPAVTVTVPGRQQAASIITASGTLAARREMPVGVAGEGGRVVDVLVEPGQWVGAGQVLARIDRAVQTQTAASLGAQIGVAQADARLAQANLDRAQALVSRGFISKADVDRLTATRDSAAARVRVAQAQLGETQARNNRLDIVAPAAGLVLTRSVEPGQVVGAGAGVLFRLARGGEMEMQARLGETDLARVSVGLPVDVTPVGATTAFKGQVWQLSPVIDPQTRQGIARVALSFDKALRPGGFATARIASGSSVVPLLPESAVQSDARGSYVLIVGRDNKVARRDVTVGEVNDAGVSITAGLTGQEAVVVSAGAFLNPGETVRPTRVKARG